MDDLNVSWCVMLKSGEFIDACRLIKKDERGISLTTHNAKLRFIPREKIKWAEPVIKGKYTCFARARSHGHEVSGDGWMTRYAKGKH